MAEFDISKLKRKPEIIKSLLKVENNTTTALDDFRIIFPYRYRDKKFITFSNNVNLMSIYAIVDDNNNYAVVCAPIVLSYMPFQLEPPFTIGDVKYEALVFKKDNIVIPDNNAVVTDSVLYGIFDEIYIKGNIPWFLSYDDLVNILSKSKQYAGNGIGSNPLPFEIISALITRVSKDKTKYHRLFLTEPYEYVGLNNIYYSYDNTGARLVGSYFGTEIGTALVDPETKTTKTSDILRS